MSLYEMMLLTQVFTATNRRGPMRRDELMKPDMLSEMLLLVVGTAILMFLVSTLWLALSQP